jgi:hypothetical protein
MGQNCHAVTHTGTTDYAETGGSGSSEAGTGEACNWPARAAAFSNLLADRNSSDDHCGHWRMIMEMPETETTATKRPVWNAGRSVGAKRALKPKQIWEIRFFLNERRRVRDRALFDLAIDSKPRGCDLVRMKIGDIVSGGQIRSRAIVMQQKTARPFSIRASAGRQS